MSDPFFLSIVARILAGSIPHHPQWSDATDLVRKRAAPADAVPANKHLDRKLELAAPPVHRKRLVPRAAGNNALPDCSLGSRTHSVVMPGLGPGIHVFRAAAKTWMAGTSPAMTVNVV